MSKLCGRCGKDIPSENIEFKKIIDSDPKKLTHKLETAIDSGWTICGFYGKTIHLERIRKRKIK